MDTQPKLRQTPLQRFTTHILFREKWFHLYKGYKWVLEFQVILMEVLDFYFQLILYMIL